MTPMPTLYVAGDGNSRSALERISDAVGLGDHVVFLGRLTHDHVRQLQQRADVVALVSTYEGLAMFGVESLAAGAALLMSSRGGNLDLVEHGVNGLHVDPLDPADIASGLRRILESPSLRDAMRAESSRRFERKFSRFAVATAFRRITDQARAREYGAGA